MDTGRPATEDELLDFSRSQSILKGQNSVSKNTQRSQIVPPWWAMPPPWRACLGFAQKGGGGKVIKSGRWVKFSIGSFTVLTKTVGIACGGRKYQFSTFFCHLSCYRFQRTKKIFFKFDTVEKFQRGIKAFPPPPVVGSVPPLGIFHLRPLRTLTLPL